MSHNHKNTRLGVSKLNENDFITALKEKRCTYGVSQTRLAIMAGISREHLSRMEAGKVAVTEDMKQKLTEALGKFNTDQPLTLLFDYVRIRFRTLDIQHIIRDVLKLNIKYMLHEDFGFYSYTEHYYIGDIFVFTSGDAEKGVLLELKGKGCRQFESYLLAQGRSWYDFFMDVLVDGGVMKRIDLAINDHTGILDIPELARKCNREECVSVFRAFKSYASGELVKHREQDKDGMGHTLYIGSLKSEVYFCCYEKNYEQYAKLGIPIEEATIKNRFEIRLKSERAYYAIRDLLTYYDAERTAFSIINRYVRFADKEVGKKRSDWKTNDRWEWFIGEGRKPLKLTTKPEPYTLDRTLRWIARQVDPTLLMLEEIAEKTGTDYLKEIRKYTHLTEKHHQIVNQQIASTEELIIKERTD